jgi:hypothetical protein
MVTKHPERLRLSPPLQSSPTHLGELRTMRVEARDCPTAPRLHAVTEAPEVGTAVSPQNHHLLSS